MKHVLIRWALVVATTVVAWSSAAGEIGFSRKPQATKTAGGAKVEFAVSAPTDAAVYVEDANGKIVRHLAAGVLGTNAPAPLRAGSLEQSIEWDGKDDDGKAAAGGPFRVRVGLGLKASYGGQAFAATNQAGPNKIENVIGLAAGPDGRIYVLSDCSAWVWSTTALHVFRRDGSYERTIKPFPSNLPAEKARAAGAFMNSFGAFNPLMHRTMGLSFYPFEDAPHRPAVTSDGRLILAVVPGTWKHRENAAHLAMLDGEGGIPDATYAGPALGGELAYTQYPFLMVTPDSKTVYITGLGGGPNKPTHAVYRVKLPDRGPAEVLFGEPAKAGSDKAHLTDPRGLALDGQGHLLVADFSNNRVVVLKEKDRSFAGEFKVQSPTWLGVHPQSGAVYVQSGDEVLKFTRSTSSGQAGWQDAREVGRLALPEKTSPKHWKRQWLLALDSSADTAVLWAASHVQLVRCEDAGANFGALSPAGSYPAWTFWRPAADPTRREVLCKITEGPYSNKLRVLDEKTGAVRVVGGNSISGQDGRQHRLGRDGSIYAQDHAGQAGGVIRFDREGKPRPFEATLNDPFLKGRLPVGTTGTTCWERDFSVDRKSDVYVKARGPEYHGLMSVHVYGEDGMLQRIALPMVSDGAYGPRVDPRGNLYIMEAVKTIGQPFPEEFSAKVKGQTDPRLLDWIYGSIVKFGPEGGSVWFSGKHASPLTYEGWGSDTSVAGLRTTGGNLTGTIAKAPAGLSFPSLRLEAAVCTRVTIRLKNDSEGKQAVLSYHRLVESYMEACGPGFSKTIEIKPNSDFAEYAFDMAGEKEWRTIIHGLRLVPTTGTNGTFSLDWVRIGDADKPCGGWLGVRLRDDPSAGNAGQSPLVWNFNAEDGPDMKLPPTLKKEVVGAFNRKDGATLQGALWWRPGFSPVGDLGATFFRSCHCTGSDFDVDDFGRVFAPDTGRFRVGVLDTAGNEILSFGGYGNQDNCGPDSYVVDPSGKFLRPRKFDDPKELVSPFAKPEIAFAWIVGLAVTDHYAYVADVINKRILRVRLGYAVEESCEVK